MKSERHMDDLNLQALNQFTGLPTPARHAYPRFVSASYPLPDQQLFFAYATSYTSLTKKKRNAVCVAKCSVESRHELLGITP